MLCFLPLFRSVFCSFLHSLILFSFLTFSSEPQFVPQACFSTRNSLFFVWSLWWSWNRNIHCVWLSTIPVGLVFWFLATLKTQPRGWSCVCTATVTCTGVRGPRFTEQTIRQASVIVRCHWRVCQEVCTAQFYLDSFHCQLRSSQRSSQIPKSFIFLKDWVEIYCRTLFAPKSDTIL